jgi:hypothetical protein
MRNTCPYHFNVFFSILKYVTTLFFTGWVASPSQTPDNLEGRWLAS